MLVYHTGHHELPEPDIRIGRKNADFGQGFYLSASDEFAGKWVREQKEQAAFVNRYELALDGLSVRRLERNEDWFDYIFRNRAGYADRYAEDDVIIGPIANDTIYDTLGLLTSGLLDDALALRLLRLGPSFEQIVIKTDKARSQLRFLSSRRLSTAELREMREALLQEEEAYQRMLGEAFDRI